MNKSKVINYLNVIKRAVAYIEAELEEDNGLTEQLSELESPQVKLIDQKLNEQEIKNLELARKKHIDDLMNIDCWPEAVPVFLANKKPTEEDQINRANAVLDMMIDGSLKGFKFLDYGCGDGWIAKQVLTRGVSDSYGFDIVKSDNWVNIDKVVFTEEFADIANIKFDIIMLYDVLDHCHDPLFVMSQVKSCLKKNGTVYIRCHPWLSKHGSHLYKQGINKAYLHLFLKWDEIKELIKTDPVFTRPEKNPIEAYHWWFNDFKIKRERIIDSNVSDFFHVPAFKDLLKNEQGIVNIDEFMGFLKIEFADYILTNKD